MKSYCSREQITLPKILETIKEKRDLVWCILDLDIIGDFSDREDLGKIVNEIWETNGTKKFFLNWDELSSICARFIDVTDFLVVGCKDKETIIEVEKNIHELAKVGYPRSSDLKKIYDILIDIDDGLLIGIFAQDKKIEDQCAKIFGPYPIAVYPPIEE